MKIIEAMKKVKYNKKKIEDLKEKISLNCAHLSHQTPAYDDVEKTVAGWVQACMDLSQDNVRLLAAIQRTNLATDVSIELGGKVVTKSIAEWIWRRREYADLDKSVWQSLGDRGLQAGFLNNQDGSDPVPVTVVRNFDVERRDAMIDLYSNEAAEIDSRLEVVNAVTDLLE